MVETVISDCISPQSNLDLENCKPIFSHDTMPHDAASHYQVWLQKIQQLRGYHLHPPKSRQRDWSMEQDSVHLTPTMVPLHTGQWNVTQVIPQPLWNPLDKLIKLTSQLP